MNKLKNTIYVVFSVLLLSLISADVSISPNPLSVSVVVNHPNNYSFTITNNQSFDIVNVRFSNLSMFTFPSNISLPKNTSKEITVLANTNQSFHGSIASLVSYSYYVNLPEEVTTYEIEITSNGLNQTFISIRDGDTIRWINSDTISHSLYSSIFGTITIPPNSSSIRTFNQLGTFHYYDTSFNIFNNFNGDIQVVNRTLPQLVHNPNYDFPWTVNLDSSLNPTNLSFDNTEDNYTIDQNKNSKGLLTIRNTGSVTSEGVVVSSDSDWVTFDSNNFNLDSGQTNWVTYTITPLITSTDQTNKTYNITLSIKSFNSPQENTTISVFIPYYDVVGGLGSDLGTLTYLNNVYCPIHKCSIFCSPELPECHPGNSNYSGSDVLTANITTYDLYNALKDGAACRDGLSRVTNLLQDYIDTYGALQNQSFQTSNESLQISKQAQEDQNSRTALVSVLVFGSLITGMFVWLILRQGKIKRKQLRTGTDYKKPDF